MSREIIIKTNSQEEMLKTADSIRNQLIGNKDYAESNIILNGYENEIHITFTDRCKDLVPITIFKKPSWMEDLVVAEECEQFDEKCIVCVLKLKNGYKVSGSYVHTGEGFIDNALGEKIARNNALMQVCKFEKYLEQQREYEKNTMEDFKSEIDKKYNEFIEKTKKENKNE